MGTYNPLKKRTANNCLLLLYKLYYLFFNQWKSVRNGKDDWNEKGVWINKFTGMTSRTKPPLCKLQRPYEFKHASDEKEFKRITEKSLEAAERILKFLETINRLWPNTKLVLPKKTEIALSELIPQLNGCWSTGEFPLPRFRPENQDPLLRAKLQKQRPMGIGN